MLSFTFRRVLSHPNIFLIAQRLPIRAISSNQSITMTVQRNLTTTASDQNSDSTADSKREPEPNPKSTRRKTGSSPKTVGKDKKKKEKEVVKTPKVTITSGVKPPKLPGSGYTQWFRQWITTQPKIENREVAQITVIRGAQVWNALPEYEKQQYQEKSRALRDEYRQRMTEWRESVDPAVLRELNRRRVAKGHRCIRGPRRPKTGYTRFFMRVLNEHPRTEEDYKAHFKAVAGRVSNQWRAMSDAEKAEYIDQAKAEQDAWREKHRAESQAKA